MTTPEERAREVVVIIARNDDGEPSIVSVSGRVFVHGSIYDHVCANEARLRNAIRGARNEALEEAAKVVDEMPEWPEYPVAPRHLISEAAARIRALAQEETAP